MRLKTKPLVFNSGWSFTGFGRGRIIFVIWVKYDMVSGCAVVFGLGLYLCGTDPIFREKNQKGSDSVLAQDCDSCGYM